MRLENQVLNAQRAYNVMKLNNTLPLLLLGFALAGTATFAQTTPPGTATPTTYPQGAVVPDSSTLTGSAGQDRKQDRKRNRRNRMNQNNRPTENTSEQDARYRQGAVSNGTTINNSNTTNENSKNVTTAPTGVGSNPNTSNPNSNTRPPRL
ncbi:hypothetical protein [Spirosoma montaniterrae]|uniref:Uncharacterized protein n=1 Tax=Spirosoma montaniterrae TaxID=1178516 RepID=A0A1P9WST8_9BACT|nr:hypothetical protein [Spirosoma montaniterrae]AQG78403.1 hypothetical protein AWR27_03060 [Spirosoma montaniterrae]